LTQSKDTIRKLNAQLGEQNKNTVQLKSVVSERDDQIQAFKSRPREAEARAEGSEALLKGNGQDAKPVAETDNLRRIEGIGPKISQVLYNAGITTFAQLATVDLSLVHQALLDAGIRLADPTTWPEQARLATAGDWKSLQALQGELKGGRRG
jgi:large subunit ribosomal protein L17